MEENRQSINISDEKIKRIQKYVEESRYQSINEFINKAIDLLLYSEDRKEDFEKIIKRQ